jgi:hypothetical protein
MLKGVVRRYTVASSTYEVLDVTADGIKSLEPIKIEIEWDFCEATQWADEVNL